jgi:4-hydroxy-2-oxoglutarate aldolase
LTNLQSNNSRPRLSSKELSGLLLPITTPFCEDGAVDFEGLRSNIRKWNATGISGYVVLGSTGERVHLDESEYAQVIAIARDEVSSEHVFIAGAGQQSTRGTIKEIIRAAAAVPIDAVLVITPHFYRPGITQKALIDHYQEVARESPVPVILYSMPALTGIKIEPATAALLSEQENIIGLKDSSADTEGLQETVRLVRKDFAVLTGNGTVLDAGLRAGAWGAILAVGCVAPSLSNAILRAVKSGEINLAVQLQAKLSPLAEAVTTRFGIGGLKAALEMKGYVGGGVRAPLRSPDEKAGEEIRRLLNEADKALEEFSMRQTEVV